MTGIIGGTGLYQIEGLQTLETRSIDTPFGAPSAPVLVGSLGGRKIAFLPRHGAKHEFLPSEINFRANIWALKSVGVTRILGVSAVGSLAAEIKPGEIALPSQYIDFTKGRRADSFFGEGLAAHVSTAEPACPTLASSIQGVAKRLGLALHAAKTYACVEGPRLGTRAESFFLRNAGAHLVGMTNVPEAFLAREAQICYCTIAIATDYDCWLEDAALHASVGDIMDLYKKNLWRVQKILIEALQEPEEVSAADCSCRKSLQFAVLTPESALSEEKRRLLALLRA